MKLHLSDIEIVDRQRGSIATTHLNELKNSILTRGLLHAPVVARTGSGNYKLVAGERRIRAIESIYEAGGMITHNGEIYAEGEIPVTRIQDVDAITLFAAELEENTARVELPWQDKAKALATLAELEREANPKATKAEVAVAVFDKLPAPAAGAPKPAPETARKNLRAAELVSRNLDREDIAKARSFNEALSSLLREGQAQVEAEILRRRKLLMRAEKDKAGSINEVRQGDLLIELPKMDDGVFDLIIADPPYGINAGSAGFRGRSREHHNYDDTPERAQEILTVLLREGHRITKPKANIFIFVDIEMFLWVRGLASRMGWTPWRTPIIWQKSYTEGIAPWRRQGCMRTNELIFWATKGQLGLRIPMVDTLAHKRVSRADRVHAAEKPIALYRDLIKHSTLTGDTVLDPCCGSGASLEAAVSLDRRVVGIELEERYANLSKVRISNRVEAIQLARQQGIGDEVEDQEEEGAIPDAN